MEMGWGEPGGVAPGLTAWRSILRADDRRVWPVANLRQPAPRRVECIQRLDAGLRDVPARPEQGIGQERLGLPCALKELPAGSAASPANRITGEPSRNGDGMG